MRLRSTSQNDYKEFMARCLSERAIPNLLLILCNFPTESFQSHWQSLGLQLEARRGLNLSKRELMNPSRKFTLFQGKRI